jgi:glutathione synthase
MKIAFVVNKVETEDPLFTTTRLALAAIHAGHHVSVFGVGDFIYEPDGSIHAMARCPQSKMYASLENFLADLQKNGDCARRITIDDIDVLMLRNDPSMDAVERPWAQAAAILFGQLAASRGVLVLNDPEHLATALNKTYFQHFPEEVRPRTCISRNPAEIKDFVAREGGKAVVKPLQGSGGKNVFVIAQHEQANVNQMIEAVMRDGYCVAQEFLPAAAAGDVRLFAMNGRPLVHDGQYAAFRRVAQNGDARSNMHSGGRSEPVEVTDTMLQLAEIVRPKLVRDGMFLVGLDIVEDKLIEINVFSPGGLGSCAEFTGIDFASVVIGDLERKMEGKHQPNGCASNAQRATASHGQLAAYSRGR